MKYNCSNCNTDIRWFDHEPTIQRYIKHFGYSREEAVWQLTLKYWRVDGKERYPLCSPECSLIDYEIRNGRSRPDFLGTNNE